MMRRQYMAPGTLMSGSDQVRGDLDRQFHDILRVLSVRRSRKSWKLTQTGTPVMSSDSCFDKSLIRIALSPRRNDTILSIAGC